jgi:hypothetical protein
MSSWAKRTILAAALVAAAAIPGCSGFWNPPPTTGGSGTNPASGTFYVLNQKTNQIAGFTFASGSTTPTAVGSSPYALTATGFSLAIDPTNGAFLYVGTAVGIYLYTVNSDGSLTLGNNGQPISTDPAYAMQVDPTDAWLLEAASGEGALSAVPITSSGALDSTRAVQSVALPSVSVNGLAVSPSSSSAPYVFVAMGTGGTAAVHFNAASTTTPLGTVSTIKVLHSQGGDNAVAVDPTNPLLYIGETTALSATQPGGLRVLTVGSTSITEITGSPFATGGIGPSFILPTSTGIYVSNSSVSGKTTGNITGYSVTAPASGSSSYKLALINTVTAGPKTEALALDGTSSYLLAVNYSGSPDLSAFTFDTTTTGKLDAGPTATTGTDPVGAWAIVAVP